MLSKLQNIPQPCPRQLDQRCSGKARTDLGAWSGAQWPAAISKNAIAKRPWRARIVPAVWGPCTETGSRDSA